MVRWQLCCALRANAHFDNECRQWTQSDVNIAFILSTFPRVLYVAPFWLVPAAPTAYYIPIHFTYFSIFAPYRRVNKTEQMKWALAFCRLVVRAE